MTESTNASGAVAEEANGSTPTEDPKATPAATGDGVGKPESATIPKARFDEINEKRKAAEARLAEYEAEKAKAADEAAKRAGDVETAQKERDRYKVEAEAWAEYATEEIERLTANFGDEEKELLALHEGSPLAVRLKAAQKLAARTSEPKPKGFGTNGGKVGGEAAGLIPSQVADSAGYHVWMANLNLTNEGRAMLRDTSKMNAVREEARRRKLI